MGMKKKLGLGMRTLKTGLAIWLAFWFCDLLGFPNGGLAAITTIVAIQPSLRSSLKTIKNQLIATIFGCILAVVVAYYFHGSYTAIAISAILAIVLCVRLNLKESISLLLVTIILIGQTPLDNFWIAIFQRISMIMIGLGIGFSLNLLLRPHHDERLYAYMNVLRHDYEAMYEECIKDLHREEHLSKDDMQKRIMKLRDGIQNARNIYQYSEDSRLHRGKEEASDLLYLERRMINALSSNLERLIEIHRSIVLAPKDQQYEALRPVVHDYLEFILHTQQNIFDYLLFDEPLADACNISFAQKADDVEKLMLGMLQNIEDLQPLHYWNMVIEGERILYKNWTLIQIKKKILGEVAGQVREEDLYRLQ